MPKTAATRIASCLSSLFSHPSQQIICTPVTSYPSFFNNKAATELSTPPDIATKTFILRGVFDCLCLFQILAIFVHFTCTLTSLQTPVYKDVFWNDCRKRTKVLPYGDKVCSTNLPRYFLLINPA